VNAAELLVRCLEQEGVELIVGVPGEENLDLLDALARSSIRFVPTRHEQAAGFIAATWGRLTGRVGVCLATLGPGATNLVTAAAYAQLGAMPMLMITGQKPIHNSKQGRFQIIDVVDMMAPLTKHAQQIASATAVPAAVRNAVLCAEEERPGAVLLELPEDVAREDAGLDPIEPSYFRRPLVERKAVARAVELLAASRRPVLLVGAGANRKTSMRMLRAFHAKQGIPFVTTQMGKGVLDDDDPLCLGTAAMSEGDFPHRALEHADLILNVGHDVVEKPPFFMNQAGRRVIHVNYVPAAVDTVYFPQLGLIGDIADSIWQLNEALDPQSHWDFVFFRECIAARKAYDRRAERHATGFPVLPTVLVQAVRRSLGAEDILTLDNGVYKIHFARDYPAHQPNTLLLDNALASMGAGLPSAIGAKLVHPERRVLAVCGDGGFMMNSQELETAVRLGLDLVVLVLEDEAYGMIRWKQAQMGLRDFGLAFGNPDFPRYAESYGAHGRRIASTAEVGPAIDAAFATGGVHLIAVPVDYRRNGCELFEEIPQAVAELPPPD